MLKQLILGSLLISQGAFAHIILSKHVTSGLVGPEDSFVKDCTYTDDAHVKITIKKGNGSPVSHIHHISSSRATEIKTLVNRAHRGRVVEVGASCDGGDDLLYGFINGHRVILDESFDCGRHRLNQSSVTPRLKTIARQDCGF